MFRIPKNLFGAAIILGFVCARIAAQTLAPPNGDWRTAGAPLVLGTAIYYPAGATVFFDPAVMVRTGSYEGVPLYVDPTLEPNSVIYVPIGGRLMRPYERRREGELAGTSGSRTPSFPVDLAARSPSPEEQLAAAVEVPQVAAAAQTPAPPVAPEGCGSIVESVPPPKTTKGFWIEFDGKVWVAAGPAGPYWSGRFPVIGAYHGFPVYQDPMRRDEIYVPSVIGGPLARYSLNGALAVTLSRRVAVPCP